MVLGFQYELHWTSFMFWMCGQYRMILYCSLTGSFMWADKGEGACGLNFGYCTFYYYDSFKNETKESVMSLCGMMRNRQRKQHSWSSCIWTQLRLIFSTMGVLRTCSKTCTKRLLEYGHFRLMLSCKTVMINTLEAENVFFLIPVKS